MADIELTASDGHRLDAYLSLPPDAPRGGVVVVQEIFGVNQHIRDVCDRFAQEGYAALAPAIFDRLEKGFVAGYSPDEIAKGRSFVRRLDMGKCMTDIEAAQDALSEYGRSGVVGYCLGGTVAFLAATRLARTAAASCYYGRLIQDYASEEPNCPVQLHYAALDTGIPAENYEDVRARVPEAQFYLYEGADHGFNCDRRASYSAQASTLAWSRTIGMFRDRIG